MTPCKKTIFYTLLGASLSAITSLAFAEPPMGHRGPPPEAIEACLNLAEGDACSFEGRRGEAVEGQCFKPPRTEKLLACRPDHMPPPPRARDE